MLYLPADGAKNTIVPEVVKGLRKTLSGADDGDGDGNGNGNGDGDGDRSYQKVNIVLVTVMVKIIMEKVYPSSAP